MNRVMTFFLLLLLPVALLHAELPGTAVYVPESIAANNSNKTDRVYCEMMRRSFTEWDANQCRIGQQAYQVTANPANKGRVYKQADIVINTYHVSECLDKRIAIWTNQIDNSNVKIVRYTNWTATAASFGIEPDTNRIIALPPMTNVWRDAGVEIVVGMPHSVHTANVYKTQTVLLDVFHKADTPANRAWVDGGWDGYETITGGVAWDVWRQDRSLLRPCYPTNCLVLDGFQQYSNVIDNVNAKFAETKRFQGLIEYYGIRTP